MVIAASWITNSIHNRHVVAVVNNCTASVFHFHCVQSVSKNLSVLCTVYRLLYFSLIHTLRVSNIFIKVGKPPLEVAPTTLLVANSCQYSGLNFKRRPCLCLAL